MRALIVLLACRPPDAASTDWDPPTFPGDGLPASEDTAHDRDRPDTGVSMTDTGTTSDAAPSILVADGLFAWYDYDAYGVFGVLSLLTATSTCGEIYGGTSSADGIFAYLYGDETHLSEGWAGHWGPCGAPPCAQAFWILGGEFGYLDGEVTISAYDAHYLTVDWSTEAGDGQGLTLYNCGDGFSWD